MNSLTERRNTGQHGNHVRRGPRGDTAVIGEGHPTPGGVEETGHPFRCGGIGAPAFHGQDNHVDRRRANGFAYREDGGSQQGDEAKRNPDA